MFQHIKSTLKDRQMMRTIFLLAWPTMLEEALQCIVTYADTAQVGVMGAQASAAIGLTTTVTWMTFYPLYAAGMSVTSCISIALGAKDNKRAQTAAAQAVILVLVLGLIIMALTLAVSPFLPGWLGGAPEIRKDASTYFAIICTPMLFRAASIIMGAALRATGNTKTPISLSRRFISPSPMPPLMASASEELSSTHFSLFKCFSSIVLMLCLVATCRWATIHLLCTHILDIYYIVRYLGKLFRMGDVYNGHSALGKLLCEGVYPLCRVPIQI